jgi:hypothetical protein
MCSIFCKDCITAVEPPILSQETQISNERDGDFILCCKFASCMKDTISSTLKQSVKTVRQGKE